MPSASSLEETPSGERYVEDECDYEKKAGASQTRLGRRCGVDGPPGDRDRNLPVGAC